MSPVNSVDSRPNLHRDYQNDPLVICSLRHLTNNFAPPPTAQVLCRQGRRTDCQKLEFWLESVASAQVGLAVRINTTQGAAHPPLSNAHVLLIGTNLEASQGGESLFWRDLWGIKQDEADPLSHPALAGARDPYMAASGASLSSLIRILPRLRPADWLSFRAHAGPLGCRLLSDCTS